MKKIFALILALCMVFALAACGQQAAPAAAAKIKIGMVTDVGGVNDKSFNQTSWEGLQALAKEDSRFEVNYLESKTDADYQTNINTFIDEKYDLIISVGYMLADATRAAAEANPDQKFAIIDDDTCADLPNVACLMFAQEQASYLVGLVAGSVTQSKIVGYVQGMVFPSMNKFGVGFISGVLAVCPDAQVLQYNANNFGDSAGGSTAAKDMITKGADVIYHAAGGTGMGVIEACNEEGIWAIGVDTDQSILAPEHVITSAMKRVDVASQDISKAVADGTFTSGVHLYDLSNGGVDLAPTRDHIPAEVLAVVEQAKADIIAGKIVVPTLAEEVPEFTLDS
ncbi:MAG: BMP family lipoprotein [Clostridia bacterium]